MDENLIKAIANCNDPKKTALEMLKNVNNPFLQNAVELAKKNDVDSLMKIGRNLYSQQGRDFDKEYQVLMSFMNGIK